MPLNSADCDYVRALVRQASGIVLEVEKAYLVESRLTLLAKRQGLVSAEGLVSRARACRSADLERQVVEALTTNETSFFRDHQPFEALRCQVVPQVMQARARERQLNIWCGASSSGQEPYSVAMLLREHFPELQKWEVSLIATDLSVEMIERAKQGVYNQVEVNRGLPAALLVKYFQRQGLEWGLKEEIRRMVEFRQLNLLAPFPAMPAPDIVMLRNVMIYFDVATKKSILGKIRNILRPGGYMFLGGAETTMNLDDGFERIAFDRSSCFRVRGT